MAQYIATINVPGYLPEDDEPPVFDTAQEAWSYLADERTRGEDDYPDWHPGRWSAEYSETRETLAVLAEPAHWQTSDRDNPGSDVTAWLAEHGINADGTGTVYGPTPGYDDALDLGLAYSVQVAEDDRVERLSLSGNLTVTRVDRTQVDAIRERGWISPFDIGRRYLDPEDAPFVVLSSVARGEDTADQSTSWQRSNFRSLQRDLDDVPWVTVSYTNVDALGAFVADLDSDTVDTLVKLADEYPVYDEEDMSALEDDEIQESITGYVISDVRLGLDEDVSERWIDLDEGSQVAMVRDFVHDQDGYPEHNGLEVIWDMDALAAYITERLAGIDARGNDTSIPTGDRFDS